MERIGHFGRGLSGNRVTPIRRHLGQRHKNKSTLVKPRVRQNQPVGLVQHLAVNVEQVEIKNSRFPTLSPCPARLPFDVVQNFENHLWRLGGFDPNHAIGEPGLIRSRNRRR